MFAPLLLTCWHDQERLGRKYQWSVVKARSMLKKAHGLLFDYQCTIGPRRCIANVSASVATDMRQRHPLTPLCRDIQYISDMLATYANRRIKQQESLAVVRGQSLQESRVAAGTGGNWEALPQHSKAVATHEEYLPLETALRETEPYTFVNMEEYLHGKDSAARFKFVKKMRLDFPTVVYITAHQGPLPCSRFVLKMASKDYKGPRCIPKAVEQALGDLRARLPVRIRRDAAKQFHKRFGGAYLADSRAVREYILKSLGFRVTPTVSRSSQAAVTAFFDARMQLECTFVGCCGAA